MNIKESDITVVIPMYNAQATIIDTLESICNQTNTNYIREIIVIDDGSTDNSNQIILDYLKKSKIEIQLIRKDNKGVSSARNSGIKLTKTRWIAFCDSDDIWFPTKLITQVNFINNNNDIDLVGCNHTNKQLKIFWKKINKVHKATVKELCIKMYPQTSTILVTKYAIEKCGYFDESQCYAEDGNLFIKIAHDFNYYYIPIQLTIYDNNRRGFGVSGLSSKLEEMHKGSKKNIKEFYNLGYYSIIFYCFLYMFYDLKYLRRILISKFPIRKG